MEQQNPSRHRQPDSYETGSTQPPKNYRGLIAFLLVAVIFLGGISSALGLMNIRLFRKLQNGQNAVMSFSDDSPEVPDSSLIPKDGTGLDPQAQKLFPVEGATVDSFYQTYYAVPAGFLVSHVPESCHAAQGGLQPGDVILKLNDRRIESAEALSQALLSCQAGESICLLVYRNAIGGEASLTFPLEK